MMSKLTNYLILTLTLLSPLALVSASLASQLDNPFVGRWTGIDSQDDNSNVFVMISADPERFGAQVTLRDDASSTCGGFRGILRAEGMNVAEDVLKLFGATLDCPSGGVDTITIEDVLAFKYIPEDDEIQLCFTPDEVPLVCFLTLFRGGTAD